MKEDQPRAQRVSQANGKLGAKLQYLNELRFLMPLTGDKEAVRTRVDRLCDSIEKDLGI